MPLHEYSCAVILVPEMNNGFTNDITNANEDDADASSNAKRRNVAKNDASSRGTWAELAIIFLRLGATSFGGPLAHIVLMEQEFVQKRGWMTRPEFVDLVGATNLIPGPNSTEMAIHIGKRRAGWPGLIVAGVCFIAPAALMMLVLASLYARFGAMPQAQWILRGVAPVVVAIVAQALWKFAQTALMSTHARLVAAFALFLVAMGSNELLTLALAAAFGLARGMINNRTRKSGAVTASSRSNSQAQNLEKQDAQAQKDVMQEREPLKPRAEVHEVIAGETSVAGETIGARRGGIISALKLASFLLLLWPLCVPSLRDLFASFLKIGSILYGSGYVLLAFLQSEFVPRFQSQRQLLDAVAVGQITPGPLFTTATFIGFQIAGFWGAVVATIGIFAPSFVFVALLSLVMEHLKKSPVMRAFLDSVNAASLALMLWVTILLARSATTDFSDRTAIVIALISLAVLLRTRLNSVWLLLAGVSYGALNAWLALR